MDLKLGNMTTAGFTQMTPRDQMNYLKKTAILIHRIVKGNLIVSLYWSKEFIFEVFCPKNNLNTYEIKCYDRYKYVQT